MRRQHPPLAAVRIFSTGIKGANLANSGSIIKPQPNRMIAGEQAE
jgi:hypothetical protein